MDVVELQWYHPAPYISLIAMLFLCLGIQSTKKRIFHSRSNTARDKSTKYSQGWLQRGEDSVWLE